MYFNCIEPFDHVILFHPSQIFAATAMTKESILRVEFRKRLRLGRLLPCLQIFH